MQSPPFFVFGHIDLINYAKSSSPFYLLDFFQKNTLQYLSKYLLILMITQNIVLYELEVILNVTQLEQLYLTLDK